MNWITAYKLAVKSTIFGILWAALGVLLILLAAYLFFERILILSILLFIFGILLIFLGPLASVFKVFWKFLEEYD